MRLPVFACCGNTFALIAGADVPEKEAHAFALDLCKGGFEGRPLDGVLAVHAPREGGDVRMVVYNADGTRPEACGDGLLCVAVHARAELGAGEHTRVETDAGERTVRVMGSRARGTLGTPRVGGEAHLSAAGLSFAGTRVDVGNPHCVVFVDDVESAPVEEVGRALQDHPSFPSGANVEFAALPAAAAGPIRARVFERGVGETQACGTGACALAFAAAEGGLVQLPVDVDYPGGRLRIGASASGEAWIEGTVNRLGDLI